MDLNNVFMGATLTPMDSEIILEYSDICGKIMGGGRGGGMGGGLTYLVMLRTLDSDIDIFVVTASTNNLKEETDWMIALIEMASWGSLVAVNCLTV